MDGRPLSLGLCAVFWTAIGVGILIKGPITPMVPLFTALALSIRNGSGRWLAALRPWAGVAWCLLLVLPWFVLIVKASGFAFFREAIGHDMAAKVAGGQESHGAPPGAYLLAFWVTGWPLAPFVLLVAPLVWRDRRTDQAAFLLAWSVPAWLLFEAVPTKLPHYVMPLYPALAILAGYGIERLRGSGRIGALRLWLVGAALMVLPVALPVALAVAPGRIASAITGPTVALAALAFIVAALAVGFAVRSIGRGRMEGAVACSIVAAVAVYGFVLGWFMNPARADLIALSPRLAGAARQALDPACRHPAYATVGDREPSLVFLTDTGLRMTDASGAATFMAAGPCRIAFVDRPDEAAFLAALGPVPGFGLAARVAGTNINGGKRLDIGVYVRQDPLQ